MKRTAPILAFLAASFLVAACRSSGGGEPTPMPSGPSGALGVITLADAKRAMEGLCEMQTTYATSLDGANGAFYDKVHDPLHVMAAAVEVKDRVVSARLLAAKEKVESDLLGIQLPSSFVQDVTALIDATRAALEALDLRVPPCPA